MSFSDWERARAAGAEAGITVPPAEACLQQWQAMGPSYSQAYPRGNWRACRGEEAIVVENDLTACDEHIVAEAASANKLTLVRGEQKLRGYAWYDRLPRLAAIDAIIEEKGRTWRVSQVREAKYSQGPAERPIETMGPEGPASRRVDAITLEADIRYGDGRRETRTWASDIAFTDDEASCADEIEMLIAKHSPITRHEAAELATAAFFYRSDDVDADAGETQREAFTGEALSMITEVLADADEALKERIRYEFNRGLRSHLPFDRTVTITKRPASDVDVTIAGEEQSAKP